MRAALAAGGWDVDARESRSGAHLAELAAGAARDLSLGAVVVAGGDGSVHAALPGLVGSGKAFGVVPLGTGNDFARGLGLPLEPTAAAAVVSPERVRAVDVGVATASGQTSYFACVAGVGMDEAAIRYIRAAPWLRGRLKYTYGGLRALLAYRPRRVQVRAGDFALDAEVMFVAVTNTASYGGGMLVNPGAALDDGELDVCVVERMPRLRMLRLFPTVYAGTHVREPDVRTARAAVVTIDASEPLTLCLDGEIAELATPLELRALPGALQMFAP